MNSITRAAGAALLAALVLALTTTASAQKGKAALTPDEARAQQAYALGVQAYIWGYPMVVMQRSRDAARQALFLDPHVPDLYDIEPMLEDFITALEPWLPAGWRE